MNKLYYTDPLAAAYMAREFDCLIAVNGLIYNDFEDILECHIEDCYRGKYYIHPDSYHIFEPQTEDFVGQWCEKKGANVLGYNEGLSMPLDEVGPKNVIIAQRNNKPFFWPESEEE